MPIPKVPFYFICHGQTFHNIETRFAGSSVEAQLTEKGRLQAQQAALKLQGLPIHKIITSPLQRAHQTAEILNQQLHLPLQIEPSLREQNYGDWENRLYSEVCQEHGLEPDSWDYLHKLPANAESFPNFQQRVEETISHLLTQHSTTTLLFVAHGGIFNALHNLLLQSINECDNATPYLFQPTPSGWKLEML